MILESHVLASAGENAATKFPEFFAARIRNLNTREAYARACSKFLTWCEQHADDLLLITPMYVVACIEQQPGIDAADCVIVLLSTEGLQSREVLDKLSRFHDRGVIIIPVLTEWTLMQRNTELQSSRHIFQTSAIRSGDYLKRNHRLPEFFPHISFPET